MGTKRVDFDAEVIPANGKEYRFSRDLTIARFKELEQLEIEFYYGFDMHGMFKRLKDVYADLNKSKPADAAIKLYRVMEGVADRVDKREPVALRIAALFLVTADEDLTKWDEEIAKQKIKDWQEEGYLIDDFFTLVANALPGFLADYTSILENTLTADQKEESIKKSDQPQSKEKKTS